MTTSLEARLRKLEAERAAKAALPHLSGLALYVRASHMISAADPLGASTKANRRACRVAALFDLARDRERAALHSDIA